MTNKRIKILYQPLYDRYLKEYGDQYLRWDKDWQLAMDFSSMFFISRWLFKRNLEKELETKLEFKNFSVYEHGS